MTLQKLLMLSINYFYAPHAYVIVFLSKRNELNPSSITLDSMNNLKILSSNFSATLFSVAALSAVRAAQ